jgi:hypothetical protein
MTINDAEGVVTAQRNWEPACGTERLVPPKF